MAFLPGKYPSTHSQHLEKWLGPAAARHLSGAMTGWYAGPIAVAGVPGNVLATGDGDFVGAIRRDFGPSYIDRLVDLGRRVKRWWRLAPLRAQCQANAGFASLSDLIS